MPITEYFFDWRREAETDGWHLLDGVWRHEDGGAEHRDAEYVYLGSEFWMPAWPARIE